MRNWVAAMIASWVLGLLVAMTGSILCFPLFLAGAFAFLWILLVEDPKRVAALRQKLADAEQAEIGACLDEARGVVAEHRAELLVRRRQLTVRREYGVIDDSQWLSEVEHFIDKVVAQRVDVVQAARPSIATLIEAETSAFAEETRGYSPSMSPTEYEHFVAAQLRANGWDSRVTKRSGDQGVDVIAEKDSRRLVVQCKLYAKPVGNSAVQEILAARSFLDASHAAVVSNAAFTLPARELASATNVHLVHHDEVAHLDERCRS